MALEKIIAHKRQEIAARMRARPLSTFLSDVTPTHRDFRRALSGDRTGFILEVKKASPSKGLIRDNFDAGAIARSYSPFADAISVLTDQRFFQGGFDKLREVRQNTDRPVLCKDFVVDPYQIYEARHHGADTILLMCSVLTIPQLRECLHAAQLLQMTPLLEVHDRAELEVALSLDAPIIGINNRNLKTLQVDLNTTRQLAELVPEDRICLSESGIQDHEDVVSLRSHVDGFLVGGALMGAPDLDQAVRRLIYGRTKICGIRSQAVADACMSAGVTHGGLMRWSGSSRYVDAPTARSLAGGEPLRWVGVYVDFEVDTIAAEAKSFGLHAVQLHGDQSSETVAAVRAELPTSCELWVAKRLMPGASPPHERVEHTRLLVDHYDPKQIGGTGKRLDWNAALRWPGRDQLVLSGGIGPDNVMQADQLGMYALDLSSGVEASPGQKSVKLIEQLMRQRRGRGRST